LKQYFIEIKFLNLEELTGLEINDMIFTVSFLSYFIIKVAIYLTFFFFLKFNSYNPSFTKLELWYRFFFLVINFIVIVSKYGIYIFCIEDFILGFYSNPGY
jgi:hypothetical protein